MALTARLFGGLHMLFPVPFLIILQIFLNELTLAGNWQRFLYPVDGLSRHTLLDYDSYRDEELKLVFYVKSGDRWQTAGEPDGIQWSGYTTIQGGTYRYAQAVVYVKKSVDDEKGTAMSRSWEEVALLDTIPTVVPDGCLLDYKPVMELVKMVAEAPRIQLHYSLPVANFSRKLLVDVDSLAPGNQGDFGAAFLDADGFERHQRGINVASPGGRTIVKATALGRVVLVSRKDIRTVTVLDPVTGIVGDLPHGSSEEESIFREYGNCVYVEHPDGYTIRYSNLDDIEVRAGQGVLRETRLGSVEGTEGGGEEERPAWVHIEVRWGDPLANADSVPMNPWEFFGID
jgi:hypothetical protein